MRPQCVLKRPKLPSLSKLF